MFKIKWRESFERLSCFYSRSWLILFALVALASTARANHIVGVTDCNCTNLTIQLSEFPPGPLVAYFEDTNFNDVNLDFTYDYANQTITVSRPAGLVPGTYWLAIWQDNVFMAAAYVSLCECDLSPCASTIPGISITENCPPGPVSAGGSVVFDGSVSNSGNITLTNVLVFSIQPSNTVVLGPITLDPGASSNFTGSYIASSGSNLETNSTIVTNNSDTVTTNVASNVTTNDAVTIITNAVAPTFVSIRSPLAGSAGEVVDHFEVGTNLNGLTFYGSASLYGPTLFYSIRHSDLSESIFTIIKTEVAPHTDPPRTEPKDSVGIRNYDSLAFAAPQITGASSVSFYYLRHDLAGPSYFGYIIPGGVYADMFSGGSIGSNFDALTFAAPNAAAQGANLFYYLRHDVAGNTLFGDINPDAATSATATTDLFNLGKKIDYMTFSSVDVGYGPENQFYYLRYDTNGNTVFGTINATVSFAGTPSERAVDRFTLTGHFQELEFTDTDVGYNANLFYSIRGGVILTTNTATNYTTNTFTTLTTNTVTTYTTNSVVSFTPTNTVTAVGEDICQARAVAAAVNCLGPVSPSLSVPFARAAAMMPNGFFSFSFPAENGISYTVQCKNALNDPAWTGLETVVGTGGNLSVTDPDAAHLPRRFYRIIFTP